MAARTGRPYKLQVLSTNGERKLQGSANNPTTRLWEAVNRSVALLFFLMSCRILYLGHRNSTGLPVSSIESASREYRYLDVALGQSKGRLGGHPSGHVRYSGPVRRTKSLAEVLTTHCTLTLRCARSVLSSALCRRSPQRCAGALVYAAPVLCFALFLLSPSKCAGLPSR